MSDMRGERHEVEEYLKLHCIQECLDEVINDLVDRRPSNPFIAITKMMETKTLSEISDVQICSAITGKGGCGVLATVVTNIGSFSATVAYPYDSIDCDSLSDYSAVQENLRDSLNQVDPRELSNFDRVLDSLEDLDECVAMAVSMACCRAGARHNGQSLYRYINDALRGEDRNSVGNTLKIPLPVVAILSRARVDDG
jgi:enolase